jgi:glutamate--cysteine ligase
MEQHFAGIGCAEPGRAMMTATAALQVNLDAGPESAWAQRVGLASRLGPVLVAISAASPYIAGRASGWASMRQQAWLGIDGRSAPLAPGDPAEAWAEYALAAPVMLVRDDGDHLPVTRPVPFAVWLGGGAPFTRPPTFGDLDYHLTTLFPPIRPRGYLEIRFLDALPDRWWPGLAAITATLLDDPVAADVAAEACEPLGDRWTVAARDGLRDPALRRAAGRCAAVAADRAPAGLAQDVAALADLVAAGRSPGDELAQRIQGSNPLRVLEEEARA